MNTQEQNRKRESFDTHMSLLNHYINFNSYKSDELIDVIVEISRMMICVEALERKFQQNGGHKFIGTPDWYSTMNVINTMKLDVISKLTKI